MARSNKPATGHRSGSILAKAKALWQKQRYDEALRSFQEALRHAPNDPGVLIDAGRAFGARYQTERSMALLEKALRLGPRSADVQHAVGESFRLLGRFAEAEACFRRACQLAAAPQAALELAKICERRHALDEADQWIARALRAETQSPAALLLRARIERRRGELDQARATLGRLTSVSSPPPQLLAEAHGEMCAVLDAAGEYDAAWEAILRCKQLLLARADAAWNAAEFVLARCRRMVESLSPAAFDRWISAAEYGPPERLAVLTGFPRSGTTLVEQILDAHPSIVSTEETPVFGGEVFAQLVEHGPPDAPLLQLLDELRPDQIIAARQWYVEAIEATLGEPIGARLHVDKNPAMNLMIPALRRVFPEVKLVIMLRDPRDVVLSCFLRYLPVNPVSVCFLTLERTVDRYALDLGAWLKMRSMIGDWIEVRYEHLVADLEREARRTLQALDVPWDDAVLRYRTRSGEKLVRSPSYEEVSRPIFTGSLGRWQNYERHLQPVFAGLAPLVEALGYER